VGTPGAAATDTRASSAIALTRASLDAVTRTSAVTELTLAWLPGVAGTSAATDVTRLSAMSGHKLRPDLRACSPWPVSKMPAPWPHLLASHKEHLVGGHAAFPGRPWRGRWP